MVKALRNGTAPEPKRPHHKKAKPVNTDKSLPEGMGAVWSFLVAHDTPEGVAAAAIATGLGLTVLLPLRGCRPCRPRAWLTGYPWPLPPR